MNEQPTFFDEPTKDVKEINFNIPLANKIDNYYYQIMPELTTREEEVLKAMKTIAEPCTMHQVANFMGVGLNSISGRFSKLVEKEKIKPIGKTKDKRPKTIYEVV